MTRCLAETRAELLPAPCVRSTKVPAPAEEGRAPARGQRQQAKEERVCRAARTHCHMVPFLQCNLVHNGRGAVVAPPAGSTAQHSTAQHLRYGSIAVGDGSPKSNSSPGEANGLCWASLGSLFCAMHSWCPPSAALPSQCTAAPPLPRSPDQLLCQALAGIQPPRLLAHGHNGQPGKEVVCGQGKR